MTASRRRFLKTLAAGAAAPFLLPARVWAAPVSPNERVAMGFVGMGTQNRGLLGNFLGQGVEVKAVCDVDTTRRNAALKLVEDRTKAAGACQAYVDFQELVARKDIDAVCIATPDHWHAIITLAALRAGKDVYCEKPLTHNIHEAVEVMKAVDANRRVLQTGSMQRSMKEFRTACELVRNGVIGRIERVECAFGDPGIPCDLKEEPAEPGLDWDRWLGPAPVRPYSAVLSPRGVHSGFPHWRTYREYGGGMVTDWGAHHLDIAQWGLAMDESGPVEILPPENPKAKRGATLVYANGVKVIHKDGFGVHFFGADGEIKVNRGRFEVIVKGETLAKFTKREDGGSLEGAVAKMERQFLKDAKVRLYRSASHPQDFLACLKSRQKPNTNEQIGGRSAICCHLMNLAYYHGKKLQWDPARLAFAGGSGDPAWLTRDYRAPWRV